MKDWKSIHPTWKEAIGVHCGLQRLGFKGEDIFVHLNPDKTMAVVLQTQGKQFAVHVGKIDLPEAAWEQEWLRLATAVVDGTIPDAILTEWYNNSIPKQQSTEFVTGLIKKGLLPRQVTDQWLN